MQGTITQISSSEKVPLYLSAIKQHTGLALTFALTLIIPLGGITIGMLGDELLLLPIAIGTLFFLISYFIFSTLKSSICHYYETTLVNQFGSNATATVLHKSAEDNTHYFQYIKNKQDASQSEETVYFIEYKYTHDRPYKSTFVINNKALYDKIEINSEVPIKILASSCKTFCSSQIPAPVKPNVAMP